MVESAATYPTLQRARTLLREAAIEMLWPARCCICDVPGTYFCQRCETTLPYLDHWRACPSCGAAWGQNLCTECNTFTRKRRGVETDPLDGCASVIRFEGAAARLVTVYKDRHESALAPVMARLLAANIEPSWVKGAVLTTIPARKSALRQRGFDHMQLVARELERESGIPYAVLFQPWDSADQRALNARRRMSNMQRALRVLPALTEVALPETVIVVDDVLTTGATTRAAAYALKEAGVSKVYALTLARV